MASTTTRYNAYYPTAIASTSQTSTKTTFYQTNVTDPTNAKLPLWIQTHNLIQYGTLPYLNHQPTTNRTLNDNIVLTNRPTTTHMYLTNIRDRGEET